MACGRESEDMPNTRRLARYGAKEYSAAEPNKRENQSDDEDYTKEEWNEKSKLKANEAKCVVIYPNRAKWNKNEMRNDYDGESYSQMCAECMCVCECESHWDWLLVWHSINVSAASFRIILIK